MSDKPSFSSAFPVTAEIVSEFRSLFGSAVKPTFAKERDREMGKPLDEGRYTVISGADMVIKHREGSVRG